MFSSEVVSRHRARLGVGRGPKRKAALPLACNLWKHAQPPAQHLRVGTEGGGWERGVGRRKERGRGEGIGEREGRVGVEGELAL